MKKALFIFIGFFVIVFLIGIISDVKRDIIKSVQDVERKVQIKDIRFYGYRDKKLALRAHAREAWSGGSIEEAYLNDVIDGEIYNDSGRLVMHKLKAKNIYSNSRYDSIVVKNGFSGLFIPSAYSAEKQEPTDNTLIEAEKLRYDSAKKKTYIEKNVRIVQDKTEIFADKAEIENEENIAHFRGNITLTNEEMVLNTDKLVSYLNKERSVATEGVKLVWLAEPTENITDNRRAEIRSHDTIVTCQDIDYCGREGQETADLSGNVKIEQFNKKFYGDRAFYDGQEEKIYMFGHVKVELTSLDWLLRKETRQEMDSEEKFEEALQKQTTVTGEELVFDRKTRNLCISGNVYVDQPKNEAHADTVYYHEKKEYLDLKGNVDIREKEKNWIKSSRARMFLKDRMFEAMGGIEARFKMKKND